MYVVESSVEFYLKDLHYTSAPDCSNTSGFLHKSLDSLIVITSALRSESLSAISIIVVIGYVGSAQFLDA